MKRTSNHDIICFDVDSTLVTIEGVDWLAEQKGVGEQVKELTSLSMEGTVPLDQVFCKKLDLLAPSEGELEMLGNYYRQMLTEDAREVIEALQLLNKEIWLVTGSFAPAIEPLARDLKIPLTHVISNTVYFDDAGDYERIDTESPLTKADGKASCMKLVAKTGVVAFIGDSVTDLATKDHVKTFVGFGGIAKREKVRKNAHKFITTESLAPLLVYVLTEKELVQLERRGFKWLIKKARKLANEAL